MRFIVYSLILLVCAQVTISASETNALMPVLDHKASVYTYLDRLVYEAYVTHGRKKSVVRQEAPRYVMFFDYLQACTNFSPQHVAAYIMSRLHSYIACDDDYTLCTDTPVILSICADITDHLTQTLHTTYEMKNTEAVAGAYTTYSPLPTIPLLTLCTPRYKHILALSACAWSTQGAIQVAEYGDRCARIMAILTSYKPVSLQFDAPSTQAEDTNVTAAPCKLNSCAIDAIRIKRYLAVVRSLCGYASTNSSVGDLAQVPFELILHIASFLYDYSRLSPHACA